MTGPGARRLTDRLRDTPVLHLADQVLSSGTNFLGVFVVARRATPEQFGVFSVFLMAYFFTVGFNRAVPHAVAMTQTWDDDRTRSAYFFLPPLAVGVVSTVAVAAAFAVLDPSFLPLALLLLPLLLQDAARMHAFAVQRPLLALVSDGVWLAAAAVGLVFTATAAGAATAWAVGGVVGLAATRPWLIRVLPRRRPIAKSLLSAALEYVTFMGLGFVSPLMAAPFITLVGVGALQGANVIRGPFILLLQALTVHRMSGPPITTETCVREAARLSATLLGVTILFVPPMILLRNVYGPPLLGPTWPAVAPLVVPILLSVVVGSMALGPIIAVRKMGRFPLAAAVHLVLAPFFLALPLAGAAVAGTEGFIFGSAGAYGVAVVVWWTVLPRVAAHRVRRPDPAVA